MTRLITLTACAILFTGCQSHDWLCMVKPTLARDGKTLAPGFDIRCTKHF